MKRLISLFMVLIMIVSLVVPTSAQTKNYTFVFVHGMGGWGPESDIDKILPYWGSITGSLTKYLRDQGYSVAEASVGPFSSTWDRTCELYAQLTGTTTDYGEAHSKKHNHERYGKTYTTPLVKNWSADNKINLIGHSFGGETIRLLSSLLTYGCQEEINATKENTSPLFKGNAETWVNSIVTLDSPHNGTTLYYIVNTMPNFIKALLFTVNALGDITANTILNDFYNVGLPQFKASIFATGTDHTGYDLSPEGAAELNSQIKLSDKIYYFSYASVTTTDSYNIQVPEDNTLFILKPTSLLMGAFKDKTFTQANDGLVNLNSALYPFNDKHTQFDINNIEPGIWNVMPIIKGHHGTILGMDGNINEIHTFYINLLNMINDL